MNILEARAIAKAINRHHRRRHTFEGGRQYGIDFPTWSVCYPQTCAVFMRCAQTLTGRKGFFMPKF